MRKLVTPMNVLKLALPMALMLGVAAGVLAQEAPMMPSPTYIVQAGAAGPTNADILAFAPQNLQVHRGDTVTWVIGGFHNIHFGTEPTPLIIAPEVDGQPLPQLNPAVAFPNVENGGAFTGEPVGSGLPGNPPAFTLVIDAPEGTYNYFCDIHPGMAGSITVVADDVALPDANAVTLMAGAEIGAAVGEGFAQYFAAIEAAMQPMEAGAHVWAGVGTTTTNNMFIAPTVVINAGETVTWELQADSLEIHTITWPPFPANQEFIPIEQEGGPPILSLGPVFAPTVENGGTVGADGVFNYVISPGETFSLTFSDPGVYPYICQLHAGMNGTVVVMPAA